MNESEFENELRALQPAPPSDALVDRIEHELRPLTSAPVASAGILPKRRRSGFASAFLPSFGWALAGAAASVVVVLALQSRNPKDARARADAPLAEIPAAELVTSAAGEEFGALESSRELVSAAEEDLVIEEGDEPARRVRFTYVERHTWTNPDTGARIEVEVPREDIVLVPVAMQ